MSDNELRIGYEELERHLRTAPTTWVPGLLRAIVQRSVEANVFVEGGLERFVESSRSSAKS